MTTEHFTLVSARSSSVAETNGRATLYLATLSSSIVALALVAQLSKIGVMFFTFAFVLLPMVFFLGLVTTERILQLTVEYFIYSRSINRIRGFYAKTVPEMATYYVMPATDDPMGTMGGLAITGRWRRLITMAGTIATINSIVAGVCAGLVVGVILDQVAEASTAWSLGIGSLISVAVLVSASVRFFIHQRHFLMENYAQRVPVLFPTEEAGP
jgi:hypothetical protein